MAPKALLFGIIYQIFFTVNGVELDQTFYPPKVWWAKKVKPDLYTAGRLSARQVKYAGEVGFKSIISTFNFSTPSTDGLGLASYQIKDIVDSIQGLTYQFFLNDTDTWRSLDAVHKFKDVYKYAKKPVLLHCNSGYSATYMVLLYMGVDSLFGLQDIFQLAADLGYDYFKYEDLIQEARKATGQWRTHFPIPKPKISHVWNRPTWWVKPVYNNWYIAGQIQQNHLLLLMKNKFKTIVNVRQGLKSSRTGQPSQEEVTLMNIRDGTGTYEGKT